MTPDRALYRAMGMQAALISHPLASAREKRKIAEDLAAVIEAFATETVPASPHLEPTS